MPLSTPPHLKQGTGVGVNHRAWVSFRSARSAVSRASLLGKAFLPKTFLIHLRCSSRSHRGRAASDGITRSSLATGLESRVTMISSSTCKAASASGHRWRKSRIVIVFTGKTVEAAGDRQDTPLKRCVNERRPWFLNRPCRGWGATFHSGSGARTAERTGFQSRLRDG